MDIAPPEREGLRAEDIELLLNHPELFDPAGYAERAGQAGPAPNLAAHYLAVGEAQGIPPSAGFDPRFYLATNPDVASGGSSPLRHYIRHGAEENRYPTRARLRADARLVEESGLFDSRTYLRHRPKPRFSVPGLTPADEYLLARDAVLVSDGFDGSAYMLWFGREVGRHTVPLLHYLDIGLRENRCATWEELKNRRDTMETRFDEQYYLRQLPNDVIVADALDHYILHGSRLGYDPEPDFATDYYARRCLDLQGAPIDLYYHFVRFGVTEGRIGRPDFLGITTQGLLAYDPDKPTILVASHEASRTGAPLVGLNVGARLAGTHNVIFHLGRTGSLIESFKAQCCLAIVGGLDPLDAEYLLAALKRSHLLSAVLLNSVETSPFARAALYAGLPSVALVHEFAEYTFPAGRMSALVESVDRVVVPAELIRESLVAELAKTREGAAGNIRVRPQGCLPELPADHDEDDMTAEEILAFIGAPPGPPPRIVLGAGYVQMRKGVDLFVQTAAEVRRRFGDTVRFIWVGEGYEPKRDLAYSAWVGDMVRRLDLEETVFFLPSQSSLDLLFEMSAVFFLSSRLDPFPNVVLDAMRAGRAVVCFDRATGSASLFGQPDGATGAAVAYWRRAAGCGSADRRARPGRGGARAAEPARRRRRVRLRALHRRPAHGAGPGPGSARRGAAAGRADRGDRAVRPGVLQLRAGAGQRRVHPPRGAGLRGAGLEGDDAVQPAARLQRGAGPRDRRARPGPG